MAKTIKLNFINDNEPVHTIEDIHKDESKKEILFFNEEYGSMLVEDECAELKSIFKEFLECYTANKDRPIEEWLSKKIQEQLPDRKPEEIIKLTNEIAITLKAKEENQASLSTAISNGRNKESGISSTAQKVTSVISAQETAKYFEVLDGALETANESLYSTITTQAGAVSRNPRLDGYIAEQYHAQTFNMNAEAKGSSYRAKVLEPTGNGYAKNSVDIVIVDGDGKVVRRYQSKYGKDAKATEQMFEHGDYRGQQKLVPKGQEGEIQKKSTTVIEAPDGTTSNPLTKPDAEQMRDEAQSGKWKELNWDEYAAKDLAIGIGKQAGCAFLLGAAIGASVDVAQKLRNGEDIEAGEVVETALVNGADLGTKAAMAGALTVGVRKKLGTLIPTPAITNIASAAIDDAKAVGKMMSGELSVEEFMDEVRKNGAVLVAGLIGGIILPPVLGKVMGMIITTVSCSAIILVYNTSKHLQDFKLKESQIRRLESEALKEMKNQRLKFREVVQREYKIWDESIQSGFEQILKCASMENYNLQGVTEGLDKILSVFGKEVAFKKLDDYENQLDMPLRLEF